MATANSRVRTDPEFIDRTDDAVGESDLQIINFEGEISSTDSAGRSAVVRLRHEESGTNYAVITPSTKGRQSIMNGVGRLDKDLVVVGTARKGLQALQVLTVRRKDK